MTEPDPQFDATHPSGQVLFRSCRGGYLHSVVLGEGIADADSAALADAVLLTAQLSHLKAVMEVRQEILEAGFSPSAELPSSADLNAVESALRMHRLGRGG